MTVLPPIQTQSLGALTPGLFDASQYQLVIEIDATSLSYFFWNLKDNKIDFLSEYQSTPPYDFGNLILLNDVFSKDKMLTQKGYNKVTISTSLSAYQLFPTAVEAIHAANTTTWQKTDKISVCDANLFYDNDTQVLATLSSYFPDYQLKHQLTGLIHHIFKNNLFANDAVVCHFHSGKFTVVAIKNGELHLANTYPFGGAEDVIYFVQLIFQQLNFEQLKTPLILSGEINRQSQIVHELSKYFEQINYASRNQSVLYNASIAALPPHFYHSLIGTLLCVL